jgi:hypothetical protein
LDLARTSATVTASVFLHPADVSNRVQGDHNGVYNTDGVGSFTQSYTSTAVQGAGTSTITEAFTRTVNATGTHILGTLTLNSPSMSWASSGAEEPYASAGTTFIITFTASTSFSYSIGLTSTGSITNNGVTTSPSRQLTLSNAVTNQNILTDFSLIDGSYTNTLPAGQYRIIISSFYGGPFAADSDGSASRGLSASVNITAIPEPSTTVLCAALAVFGMVAVIKITGRKCSN